jgi:hypothetical protein
MILAFGSAGPLQGETSLVICARVGEAPFVPRGYRTADCSECRSAVWINPDIVYASERRGMIIKPLCGTCATSPKGGKPA